MLFEVELQIALFSDGHGVLSAKREPCAARSFPIHVVVGVYVDYGPVPLSLERVTDTPERSAERRVRITPGIPRQPPNRAFRLRWQWTPDGHDRTDHRLRSAHGTLGVTGHLGPRGREPHVGP